MNIINTPKIETERLILRRFAADDAKAFFEIMSDKEVNTFLPLFPLETMEEAEEYLREKYLKPSGFRYAVCLKSNNIPIGYVCVSEYDSYDLGYGLRKDFWHQGITTEACKAVIGRLKEVGIPYITAAHDINNPRSGQVMKNIGMTYRYSYEEQWQPKNFPVVFRMYQLNFDVSEEYVYLKYWNQSTIRFIEKEL